MVRNSSHSSLPVHRCLTKDQLDTIDHTPAKKEQIAGEAGGRGMLLSVNFRCDPGETLISVIRNV